MAVEKGATLPSGAARQVSAPIVRCSSLFRSEINRLAAQTHPCKQDNTTQPLLFGCHAILPITIPPGHPSPSAFWSSCTVPISWSPIAALPVHLLFSQLIFSTSPTILRKPNTVSALLFQSHLPERIESRSERSLPLLLHLPSFQIFQKEEQEKSS